MQFLPRAVAFGLLAALAPALAPALAHEQGEHLGHMSVIVEDVAPGATNVHALSFDEMGTAMEPEPLRKGWLFGLMIVQQGEGAPLRAAVISEDGAEAGNWSLARDRVNKLTALLPETNEYRVHVTNPGNATTRYAFYFDQSCNCAGKPLPKELPGMVIFNVDGQRGQRVRANFPQPAAVTIQVTAARLVGGDGAWPADFEPLGGSSEPNMVRARDDLPAVPIHELVVEFEAMGRIFFMVEPIAFASQIGSVEDLMVTPFYEPLKDAEGSPASGLGVVALGLAAALGATSAVRRR